MLRGDKDYSAKGRPHPKSAPGRGSFGQQFRDAAAHVGDLPSAVCLKQDPPLHNAIFTFFLLHRLLRKSPFETTGTKADKNPKLSCDYDALCGILVVYDIVV
jgi:hypothetical protein